MLEKNNQSISQLAGQLICHYQIPFRSGKKDALHTIMQKIDQKEKDKNKPVYRITWFYKAGASVAAIAAILIGLYFFTESVHLSSGDREIITYRLPDASRVVLYKNSQIEFKRYFWRRNVELDGIAYFEVNKGDGFKVRTGQGHVEVIGTRFLVSDDSREFEIRCFQGRIKTHYHNNSWILDKGTQISGNKNDAKREKLKTDLEYPDFAMFKGYFSGERFIEVVGQLESFFDIEIVISEGATKNFSGTLETGNLESALQIVCESLQLNYRFVDQQKVIITKNLKE